MGIHLTYTPVVDIAVRPDNPAEGVRSFGGDIELLGRMVRAYVRGYHENGMLTTAKHFPGRGDVERMPENPDWSWINKPAEAVEAQEFAAFRKGIEAGVDFIMTEHIAVPSVTDGSVLPASVEKRLATGWIRDKLGFKGVLTSDDLWYDSVVKRFGAEEVALKAFEAGHDIILKPKDPAAVIAAMAAAVKSGRLSEGRIDEAVRKLLTLKARLNLHKNRFVDEGRVGEFVGTPGHLALVQEVADRSLTMVKNDGVLPLAAGRPTRAVHIIVQKYDPDPVPGGLAAKMTTAFPGTQTFFLRPDMDAAIYEKAWKAVRGSDLVILSLFVPRNRLGEAAPFREGDLAFLSKLIAAKPKAVVAMSFGNAHLIRKIPAVGAFLVGYGERGWFGNQVVYFDTFVKALKGEIKPSGRLPVKVSDRYPLGAGLSY
jgi:beta-N-acetylhexosaminidase